MKNRTFKFLFIALAFIFVPAKIFSNTAECIQNDAANEKVNLGIIYPKNNSELDLVLQQNWNDG